MPALFGVTRREDQKQVTACTFRRHGILKIHDNNGGYNECLPMASFCNSGKVTRCCKYKLKPGRACFVLLWTQGALSKHGSLVSYGHVNHIDHLPEVPVAELGRGTPVSCQPQPPVLSIVLIYSAIFFQTTGFITLILPSCSPPRPRQPLHFSPRLLILSCIKHCPPTLNTILICIPTKTNQLRVYTLHSN